MTFDPVQERTIAINQRYGFLKMLTHDGLVQWIEVTLGIPVPFPTIFAKNDLIWLALELEYGKEDVDRAGLI